MSRDQDDNSLPKELTDVGDLLRKALAKEPAKGLSPAQLQQLHARIAAVPRSTAGWRKFFVILAPIMVASIAGYIYQSRPSNGALDRDMDAATQAQPPPVAGRTDASLKVAQEKPSDTKPAGPTIASATLKPTAKDSTTTQGGNSTKQQKIVPKPAHKTPVTLASNTRAATKKGEPAKSEHKTEAKTVVLAKSDAERTDGKVASAPPPPAAKAQQAKPSVAASGTARASGAGGASFAMGDEAFTGAKSAPRAKSKRRASAESQSATDPTSGATSVRSVSAEGSLDDLDVKPVISQKSASLRACYASLKQRAPETGKIAVEIRFVAKPSGALGDVSVDPGSRDEDFARCLSRTIKKWKLPAADGPTTVDVSLAFD